jgi:hypothetical protein
LQNRATCSELRPIGRLGELVGNTDKITVELVPSATADVHALIGELDQMLSVEYAPE